MKLKIHTYHYRLILILFGTVLYFLANIQRVAIPGAIFNTLQQELQVAAPSITALGAAFMYVYAFNQLVIGVMVERYGGARVIAMGTLLFCIGAIMFPLSNTLFWLYCSRALTGLGASSIYLSLVKEVKRTFGDRNFPLALSILVLAGYTGGIMANAPFAYCAHAMGWRTLLLVIGMASILFYILFLLTGWRIKQPKIREEVKFSFMPFIKLLKNTHNIYVFLFSGINFGLYYVLQTVIGKKFLEDFCRISGDTAGWILSLMAVISALSGLFLAVLSRMMGNRRQIFLRIAGAMSVSVFLIILLCLVLDKHSILIAVLMCMLPLFTSTAAVTVPLLHETNPSRAAGPAVCMMNFTSYIVVAAVGNAVGVLMNIFKPELLESGILLYGRHSYTAVFSVMLLLASISAYCAWRCRETFGRPLY